jgi:pimeloyl-ACP methyl ester carboxylesterase
MTRAFVHGNPETSAIWRPLVDSLAARGVTDVVLLSPPGFGAPVPDGWPATREAYRDWLIGELEALGGDVDLVGHDWGAGHVFGVLAERPELVRTWAADCIGLVAPDYEWHDMAQAWQTPEVGEQTIAAMTDPPLADRVRMFEGMGIPGEAAYELAEALDATTGRCILELYRSAAQPVMADLGRAMAATALPPGLVVVATDDHYAGSVESMQAMAAAFGATTVVLEGLGHWWMFDGANTVADALVEHWSR